ncbi:MAG: NAD(P)/FAD-dependent oxidoreductase [Candidatus Paceibacterota bacterium]|jgi:NAD(P)H-nitrite reductase large subunit
MLTHYKYLIIGGGIAGTTAAETIRQYDKDGTLAILSNESYRLYSRIVISKPEFYEKEGAPSTLFLKKPEWYLVNNIDLLANETVVGLDTKEKIIKLASSKSVKYDKLLLSIGVQPSLLPDLETSKADSVLYLHNLDQAKEIEKNITHTNTVVVVGGGFIAIELCDLLLKFKKKVISIIVSPRYWRSTFNETSSRLIEDALRKNGVEIHTESTVKRILNDSEIKGIDICNTKTGVNTNISCQTVIAAIGTQCHLDWVKGSGIECNKGILTNEYLETSKSDIWAAGDCAEYFDLICHKQIKLANWTNARVHGKIAGVNMVGKRSLYRKTTFFSTEKLGLSICFVGDTSPVGENRKTVSRGSYEHGAYTELRIVNNRIVGATAINMADELSSLVSLIENEISIENHLNEISDPNFNLKSIINKL